MANRYSTVANRYVANRYCGESLVIRITKGTNEIWRKDEPRTSDTSVFGISDLENHFVSQVSLNFNCFAVASIPWYVLSCKAAHYVILHEMCP